ncbi:hypothetical protein PEC302107_31630 [Pectobacterium araliae]|uniref:GIY-YIG domain-containing protein n=1 Tax=Pectobacterium araliae TaxID=3073862 RepID=A0AAN0KIA3_9GAMM|nr:hypothetical protein PEC302110_04340 [Pectobacterium sp. MAFF 302110]GKW21434.1 hypothetical protein PEC302107_31630 [Pectobacterium carotovorum subsp. carotovorum]
MYPRCSVEITDLAISGVVLTAQRYSYFYVGVTKRSWQKRWAEHKRAITNDSPLLFHRKYREEMQNGCVTYLHHKVMEITNDLEQLYEAATLQDVFTQLSAKS